MVEMADLAGAEYFFGRREHRELLAGVDAIRNTADAFGWSDQRALRARVGAIRKWCVDVLEPHARWEDAVAYAEVDRRTGTEWATRMMRYEHGQIQRIASDLETDLKAFKPSMTHEQTCAVRGHLIALEALLRAHIEREEVFIFPVIAGPRE